APSDCVARSGFIEHAASGRRASYGELALDAAKLTPPSDPALKPRQQWRLLGTSFPRLELPSRVDGSAIFGPDVVVEGMLVAAVKLCPVAGGTLERVDPAPALAIKGCRAVVPFPRQTLFVGDQYWKGLLPLEAAVIVVADHYWAAQKGLEALRPVWSEGANARLSNETQQAALATFERYAQQQKPFVALRLPLEFFDLARSAPSLKNIVIDDTDHVHVIYERVRGVVRFVGIAQKILRRCGFVGKGIYRHVKFFEKRTKSFDKRLCLE
ncbi:hypothetical protein HUU05_28920, partial [candidate division KSB1 bacterium]|nr:hypothetical protein [candidate division KSB1 bacterium]